MWKLMVPVLLIGGSSLGVAQTLETETALSAEITLYLYRCPGGGTECRARCRPNETLVSGGCALASGSGALANSWMRTGESGEPAWSCRYQAQADIYAQAICFKP